MYELVGAYIIMNERIHPSQPGEKYDVMIYSSTLEYAYYFLLHSL